MKYNRENLATWLFFRMILNTFFPALSEFSGSETVADVVSVFMGIERSYEYNMSNFLNFFIAVLVLGWLIGLLAFNAGGLIHMFLIVAVIVLLLKVIAGKG